MIGQVKHFLYDLRIIKFIRKTKRAIKLYGIIREISFTKGTGFFCPSECKKCLNCQIGRILSDQTYEDEMYVASGKATKGLIDFLYRENASEYYRFLKH